MRIVYTHTDEAPALATASLLPIVRAYAGAAGHRARAAGHLARAAGSWPSSRSGCRTTQRIADALAELGELAETDEANIIKLPNISASVPQLKAAIAELQEQGYDIPDYPESPADEAQREVRARYDRVKGSAVNPVLRQGNSDRRAPASVKEYARTHPHSMGAWSRRLALTRLDDGRAATSAPTESSVTVPDAGSVRIEHVGADGDHDRAPRVRAGPGGEVLDGVGDAPRARSTRSSPLRSPRQASRASCTRSTSRRR